MDAALPVEAGKSHICVVTETYPPEVNGVALTLARLLDGLQARGYALSLVRPRQKRGERVDNAEGFPVTLVPSLPLPGYDGLHVGLPANNRLLRQNWTRQRPDAVYVTTEEPLGLSAVRAARRLGVPVVSGFHTNFHSYSRHYRLGWLQPVVLRYLRWFHNPTRGTLVPSLDLRDLDGHWSLDVGSSYGVNVVGFERYKDWMRKGLERVKDVGPVLGPLHPLVAENIVLLKSISGLDEVSFHMSGTEAVGHGRGAAGALQYPPQAHRSVFGCLPRLVGRRAGGLGSERAISDCLTLKDMHPASLDVIRRRAKDIAGVLINPVQSFHPNAPPPSDAVLLTSAVRQTQDLASDYARWLQQLAEVRREYNVPLIFDEVYSGFRLAPGGVQAEIVEQDLPLRVVNFATIWTLLFKTPSRYNWLLQYYLRAEGVYPELGGHGPLPEQPEFYPGGLCGPAVENPPCGPADEERRLVAGRIGTTGKGQTYACTTACSGSSTSSK